MCCNGRTNQEHIVTIVRIHTLDPLPHPNTERDDELHVVFVLRRLRRSTNRRRPAPETHTVIISPVYLSIESRLHFVNQFDQRTLIDLNEASHHHVIIQNDVHR